MKSDVRTISGIFQNGGNTHYILAHFQREYVWQQEQWKELLRDLLFIYHDHASKDFDPEKVPIHFMGMIVVAYDSIKSRRIPAFKLVDGQQRIITISLLLCALRDLTRRKNKTLANDIDSMLINVNEQGDAHFKVIPNTRHNDCASYTAIINGKPLKAPESLIAKAYRYLHRELSRYITRGQVSAEQLYTVLIMGFQVAVIDLEDESPYKIYESIDGKGKDFTQLDSIRNYIAMMLPAALQEEVFERDWIKIEAILHEQNKIGKSGELTVFLRHYLAMRRSILYPEDRVYARFRDYIEQEHPTPQAFIQEIGKLRRFAEYYHIFLCPEEETNTDIRDALIRLNKLDATPMYPLLLTAYNARKTTAITDTDFVQFVGLLENFIVRRYLWGESIQSLHKWFPTIWREIEREREHHSFIDACRKILSTAKYYPTDRQLRQAVYEVKLYERITHHRAKITFILLAIEEHLWTAADAVSQLKGSPTIEHIMPQTLTETWKVELGIQWEHCQKTYGHTLGNLTLVTQAKNTQLSNAEFAEKNRLLQKQGLRLNGYFTDSLSSWNEHAIRGRADWLMRFILSIWPSFIAEPLAST